MKIIYNKVLPVGRRYYAINLFGILFAKGPCDKVIINHERIHTAQMRELGFVLFYLLYVLEWLWLLLRHRNAFKAYNAISFEREAYAHERDHNYLSERKPYASFRGKRK